MNNMKVVRTAGNNKLTACRPQKDHLNTGRIVRLQHRKRQAQSANPS